MFITLVDLRLTNKEGLFRNGKVKGSLAEPETADFRISREGTKTNSRITTPQTLRRTDNLMKDLLGKKNHRTWPLKEESRKAV